MNVNTSHAYAIVPQAIRKYAENFSREVFHERIFSFLGKVGVTIDQPADAVESVA